MASTAYRMLDIGSVSGSGGASANASGGGFGEVGHVDLVTHLVIRGTTGPAR
jgi:hypothetical protein